MKLGNILGYTAQAALHEAVLDPLERARRMAQKARNKKTRFIRYVEGHRPTR